MQRLVVAQSAENKCTALNWSTVAYPRGISLMRQNIQLSQAWMFELGNYEVINTWCLNHKCVVCIAHSPFIGMKLFIPCVLYHLTYVD